MESMSRRHIVHLGKIEGNDAKMNKSPKTRRRINDVSDIVGAVPKDKGSAPKEYRNKN
jgi:hypothetical protein